jgi:cytochrome c biogenesis protein CcmG/thiol:disulfide interchange protein DsbE
VTDPQPRSSSVKTVWIVAPVAVVMLVFIGVLATGDRGDTGFDSFELEGRVAPSIVGTTIDGDEFDLDDHRGSFVIVNFFQTTCIPCRQEHPELVAFDEAYGPSGFATLVSVAFDDEPSNIRDFFEEFGGDWPVLATDTGPIAVAYGVPLVPESVLIAPDGEVITKLLGGIRKIDLEAVIQTWQEANP